MKLQDRTLSKHEFKLLQIVENYEDHTKPLTQRKLASQANISLGTVHNVINDCIEKGYLKEGKLTQKGLKALEPYKVDNAVIMAAGLSSRFAPLSYEKPKGVLKVRGEVLIERQIKQLKEVGIKDIYVVVGYQKEHFFYLEQKLGVKIVNNPYYAERNNNSSLWVVKDILKNTYICSSDDYFTQNPFEKYVFSSYYASIFAEGKTEEWCIVEGAHSKIMDVQIGGTNSWIMLGHVFFDREFSHKFVSILEDEFEDSLTYSKLWEQIFIDHISELDMTVRKYEPDIIWEFDSLDELKEFDPKFIENIDSKIFDNIKTTLSCDVNEISHFKPLKKGLTNLSCRFEVNGKKYVYRHPGVGTSKLVDRKSEKKALELAKELGLDTTYIYADETHGWKISKYIKHARSLDANDDRQLKRAMQIARQLHDSDLTLARSFDFIDEGLRYERLLQEKGSIEITGYKELKVKVLKLKALADKDGFRHCLSHNDFFTHNFIIDAYDTVNLIDWEYAGMSDEANDFGTFVVCCNLDIDRADLALSYYFDREPTKEEYRHFWAYVVFAGWCWYIWALEKQAEGETLKDWLYIYWSYAASHVDRVLSLYED